MSYTIHPRGDNPPSGHAFPLLYNLVHRSCASAEVDDAVVDCMIESVRRWKPAQGHPEQLASGQLSECGKT